MITVTSGPDSGQTYRLSQDVPHLIGRHNGTVALEDAKVSRRHAEVTRTRGRFVIHDLGSSNGTFVNNRRITKPTTLKPGSTFQVGRTICEFRLVGDEQAARDPDALQPVSPPTLAPPVLEQSQQQTHQLLHEMRDLMTRFVQPPNDSTAVLPAISPAPLTAFEARGIGPQPDPDAQADPRVLMRLDELLQTLRHQADTAGQAAQADESLPSELAMKLDELIAAVEKGRSDGQTDQTAQRIAELQQSLNDDQTRRQFSDKLDALLELVTTVPLHTEARSEALERKLDDLMVIVASTAMRDAATTLPVPYTPAPYDPPPAQVIVSPAPPDLGAIEGKLDTLLQTMRVQQQEGADNQLAAAFAAAAQPTPAPASLAPEALDELLEQFRTRIDALDRRVMQHVHQLGEAAESQLRKAITELSQALRGFTQRSDRALLEQLLHEVRGQNSQSTQDILLELRARLRQICTAPEKPNGQSHDTSSNILAAINELQAQQHAQARQMQRLMDYLDSADPMALERV